jgi:hypothetical protein
MNDLLQQQASYRSEPAEEYSMRVLVPVLATSTGQKGQGQASGTTPPRCRCEVCTGEATALAELNGLDDLDPSKFPSVPKARIGSSVSTQ